MIKSNSDCLFKGNTFDVDSLKMFTSEDLASIVGKQSPSGYEENLHSYKWIFQYIEVKKLRYATEYGEEPSIGWKNLYLQFLKEDDVASKYSPEYAGRDKWLKNEWIACTDTYPLFVLLEDSSYRILDGHHRLAGAFYYDLEKVAVILGQN